MTPRAGWCRNGMGVGPMRRCCLRLWLRLGLLVHGLPGEHHWQRH